MKIRTFVLGTIIALVLQAWLMLVDILVLFDPAVRLYLAVVLGFGFTAAILAALLIVEVQNAS